MKKVFGFLVLLGGSAVLGGCENEQPHQNCSGKGEAFFTESLDAYFVEHPQANGGGHYALQSGARYDEINDWWIVPFDFGNKQAQALLSCDGHLEISLR
ncbi:hypothetical protein DYL61_14870 [Pseudomonas nabeulensis]|uniref:Lipoprotein n=1 Tax=Pseudomonas nabeulensis TaxID=2293833 RepID=A0A4Z0B2C6_9PSED|nr:hypothetical protein [Pseudomonas nabeulensis]TFY93242.1 hypothetical protein DYL61_14870 [Pseudomonas nabeulensis]